MPRPTRAQGRPGTAVIPAAWNESHAPVVVRAMRGTVTLRHDEITGTWSDEEQQTVYGPAAPYATRMPCRVQALTETADDQPDEAAGETLRVTGYLLTLPLGQSPDASLRVGDLATVAGDPLLAGFELRVVEIVRGTERFERDLLCTVNDPIGGGAS